MLDPLSSNLPDNNVNIAQETMIVDSEQEKQSTNDDKDSKKKTQSF